MSHAHFTQSLKQNQIPIFAGSKVVGKVRGEIFHKSIKGSKHLLKRPPAIAFDVQSLEAAEQAGATKVEVLDTETKTVYTAAISHIWAKGFRLNRGFGDQIALQMTGFITARYNAPRQMSFMRG